MGGRGASLGEYLKNGQTVKYGSEYHSVHELDNVKFIYQTDDTKAVTSPMETMTKDRVYAVVNNRDQLKTVVFFDEDNKRERQIDIAGLPHKINGENVIPHTHVGYEHNEGASTSRQSPDYLTKSELDMVNKIQNEWNSFIKTDEFKHQKDVLKSIRDKKKNGQ